MKNLAIACCFCLAFAAGARAASPAQEQQFVDTYKKAYEAKDYKTLASLLYAKGADPKALAFYKVMMRVEAGGSIASIQLLELTPDDRMRAESTQSPDGRKLRLVLPATKKLVVTTETQSKNGSSSSSSEVFVAESDGRLYILVPAGRP